MYKKILVPLDGSELSEVVFPYARELAGRMDMDVVLLHVLPPQESDSRPMHQAYIERTAEVMRAQAAEIQQKTGMKPGGKPVDVTGELAVGYPAEEILRYADEYEIDQILIATHGRSGIKRWALGSVADKVLRESKVPVLLVRPGVPREIVYDKWPRRTILVPLDGSEVAESVLPHVEALAKQRGAEIVDVVLLRVFEPPSLALRYMEYVEAPAPVPLSPAELEKEGADRRRACEQYLAGVQRRLEDAGVTVRSEVLMGKAAEEIIDYAGRHPFNLIAMVTHGRSGLSRWAWGSVAEKVLMGVSSPVFLVRPH